MEYIKEMLKSFGYTVGEADKPLLTFILESVENSIKSRANISEIPKELKTVIGKRVLGEFLASKLSTGNFISESLNLEPIVKSISEGKVSITYETEGQSKEVVLKTYCGMLIAYGEEEILSFRKLRW